MCGFMCLVNIWLDPGLATEFILEKRAECFAILNFSMISCQSSKDPIKRYKRCGIMEEGSFLGSFLLYFLGVSVGFSLSDFSVQVANLDSTQHFSFGSSLCFSLAKQSSIDCW